jgi:hypothetical protein
MKTDNQIITEFMGYRYFTWQEVKGIGQAGWAKHDRSNAKIGNGFLCRTSRELKYDHSWNWLMPAWYKFRDLVFDFDQMNLIKEHALHVQAIAHSISYEDLPKAYERLVNGIKWYNQNKNHGN